MTDQINQWRELAQQLRVDSIRSSSAARSGHPTTSLSAADLMAVLMAKYLHYDFSTPDHPGNDHLIFSKGHASPLLYAMFKAAGAIGDEELMSFREFGSIFQGHPTPAIPWVDVATGSLGQGLPIGVGVALAGKYLEKLPFHVWVLCGDSEMAEGSMWEAFEKASFYKLGNLIAILDMNRLGQRGPTALGWDSEAYAARARAFGWHPIAIDGHNLEEIDRAYTEAVQPRDQPTLIIASTMKGAGVSFLADEPGWHGRSLSEDEAAEAIAELGGMRSITVDVPSPHPASPAQPPKKQNLELPAFDLGTKIATRQGYGEALRAVGAAYPDLVVLDAEVSNSTYSNIFAKAFPERFFEMFIAEQQMVASAIGFNVRNFVPFASTFGAFMSRAYDFIRMAAISEANIRLVGSHAGVSIGEDGPSQMALEDIAMMRAVYGSTVLYPSDANQTAKLVAAMAELPGISYLRTTREKTPVIYAPDEEFPVGGSKVLRQSQDDQVTVIAAGITLHEALKACDQLQNEGIAVRLIDLYSVKPIDRETLYEAARVTNGRFVVAEDHWPEGGIGEAVLAAFTLNAGDGAEPTELPAPFPRMIHLAVQGMPGSGTPAELLAAAGIDAAHIAEAVRALVAEFAATH